MKKQESRFKVEISLSVVSDDDGFFYINPSEENIKKLIMESLARYLDDELKIHKLKVLSSQAL